MRSLSLLFFLSFTDIIYSPSIYLPNMLGLKCMLPNTIQGHISHFLQWLVLKLILVSLICLKAVSHWYVWDNNSVPLWTVTIQGKWKVFPTWQTICNFVTAYVGKNFFIYVYLLSSMRRQRRMETRAPVTSPGESLIASTLQSSMLPLWSQVQTLTVSVLVPLWIG